MTKIRYLSRRNICFLAGVFAFGLVAGLLLVRHRNPRVQKAAGPPNFVLSPISRDSTSGLDHARLANDYIAQRKANLARSELNEAERLGPTNSFELECSLFQAYANLHEVSQAIKHGQRGVALGRMAGVKTNIIDFIQQELLFLEPRLSPTYVEVVAPRGYSAEEFDKALIQKLSPEEMKSVVNPLASTLEMQSWAQDLTAGAKDDMEKARKLFEALSHRLDGGAMQPLTAREAYKDWNNFDVSFHCQDYAFLYTSLARAVGLNAYAVVVDETCYGEKTAHACSAVFFGKKALLVDPSYFWFGVPHKRYLVLDDVSATALYFSCYNGMERAQIACKLAPELPQAQSALFCAYITKGDWNNAKLLLPTIKKLDSDGWDAPVAEARIALHGNQYQVAAHLLQKSIKINPSSGAVWVYLGETLMHLGKYEDARSAFLNSLNCALPPDSINNVHQQLSWLDQQRASR